MSSRIFIERAIAGARAKTPIDAEFIDATINETTQRPYLALLALVRAGSLNAKAFALQSAVYPASVT